MWYIRGCWSIIWCLFSCTPGSSDPGSKGFHRICVRTELICLSNLLDAQFMITLVFWITLIWQTDCYFSLKYQQYPAPEGSPLVPVVATICCWWQNFRVYCKLDSQTPSWDCRHSSDWSHFEMDTTLVRARPETCFPHKLEQFLPPPHVLAKILKAEWLSCKFITSERRRPSETSVPRKEKRKMSSQIHITFKQRRLLACMPRNHTGVEWWRDQHTIGWAGEPLLQASAASGAPADLMQKGGWPQVQLAPWQINWKLMSFYIYFICLQHKPFLAKDKKLSRRKVMSVVFWRFGACLLKIWCNVACWRSQTIQHISAWGGQLGLRPEHPAPCYIRFWGGCLDLRLGCPHPHLG